MTETIFIQMPAYRDSELPKTLQSLIENCKNKTRIHVAICHQYSDDDDYNKDLIFYNKLSNVKMINIHYSQSKGLGWARSLTNNLYANETYFYQLDSHLRFSSQWDSEIIDMFKSIDSKKPILTSHPNSYSPERETQQTVYESNTKYSMYIACNGFAQKGNRLICYPNYTDYYERPFPGRFVAGGNTFTYGSFVNECPPDPNITFNEETLLTLRAFTHGYDIYHFSKNCVWHEYVRENKPKVWFDENNNNFKELAAKKIRRTNNIIKQNKDFGCYGLGNKRTLQQYEEYAGIDFKNRLVHPDALGKYTPPPTFLKKYVYENKSYYITQNINNVVKKLKQINQKDKDSLDVIVTSESNHEIYRNRYIKNDMDLIKTPFFICLESTMKPTCLHIILNITNSIIPIVFQYNIKVE